MSERGVALIIALMAMLLLSALGLALVLTTSTELLVAGYYRSAQETLYGAEAFVECALQDVSAVADWSTILAGITRSSLTDGPPSGTRTLSDGSTIDLAHVTNLANCGKISTCSSADMNAVTQDRPWGINNPRWVLYAYAPMNTLPSAHPINSPLYGITWVGDDPAENDGDPTKDGSAESNPGTGIIMLRSEAFGPGGAHKVVEASAERAGTSGGVRLLSWREVR